MNRPTRVLLAIVLLASLWLTFARVRGQEPTDPLVEALVTAMRREVAVGSPTPLPVRHCRNAGPADVASDDPWARCDRRLRAFAQMFIASAERHDLDPWLLAAIARQESGYNPHASGRSHAEGGIMQLHPANAANRAVPFLSSPGYARRCRDVVGACQEAVVERAAVILETAYQRCSDPRAALNAYNLGRCDTSWSYAARIRELRARMMR